MNAPFKANVWKSVSVPVEITKADLHKMLDVNELKFECRRRGIKLKEDYDGRKYKILRVDMDEVESL